MKVYTKVPTKEDWVEENYESWLMSDRMMYYCQDCPDLNLYETAKELAEEEWEENWTPSGKYAKYYYDKVVTTDGLFSL